MDNEAFAKNIVEKARGVVKRLAEDPVVGRYIDANRDVPKPFAAKGDIRLIVVGQDPTVKREASRGTVKTVLNLDRPGALRTYVERICVGLGLELEEHVYATNAAKGFYVDRPTSIEECNVLKASAKLWLPLLRTELDQFRDATVLSLGEPVLQMLVREDVQNAPSIQMKHYWGYHRRWRSGTRNEMRPILPSASAVERTVFPFVHQPTSRGKRANFYRHHWDEYIGFVRREGRL